MRVIATFFAIILVIAMMAFSGSAKAQSKSICSPINGTAGIINPGATVASTLTGMTNRGQGSYNMAVSTCTTGPAQSPCSGLGYVSISNSSGCTALFDTVMQRPTALTAGNGFSVTYGSSQTGNTFLMTVICNPTTSLGINSASKKFAIAAGKTAGSQAYQMVVQSAAACATAPPPPAPAGASCKPQNINGQMVNFDWTPQYIEVVDGFGPETGFLFSPCANHPSAPNWAPGGGSCSTGFGYITRFTDSGCEPWSFDIMTSFKVANGQVNISYASSTQSTFKAQVNIVCVMGDPVITSPGGNFRNVSNTFYFELGIQDLCGGQTIAPWTAPPRPASMSGSGSSQHPSGGSGSMPSGGSGSMPSGGSGSSGMPSGGSGSSGMPSGGSGSSGMPSGGSGGSMPSGGSGGSGGMPSAEFGMVF